jgi:hypothetical protein
VATRQRRAFWYHPADFTNIYMDHTGCHRLNRVLTVQNTVVKSGNPTPGESQSAAGWPKGPEAWGGGFAEWASRVPDLQLRELLGDRCTPKLREPVFDVDIAGGRVVGLCRLNQVDP